MIVFVTLFVGLVFGTQVVEVSVSGPVARVELRLGDEVVGAAEGEPWLVNCDLGPVLRPARLVAVAIDAHGREIARATQWINLPDRRAEAVLLPELDEKGSMVAATVKWESPEFGEPKTIRARLDDQPIRVRRNGRIDLSKSDPSAVHVLSVDLEYPEDLLIRRELVYGAGHAGETNYELTAIPVVLSGEEEPAVDRLQDLFLSHGEAIRVAAVETGPAQLVLLRDQEIEKQLEPLLEEKRSKEARKSRRRSAERLARDGFAEDVQLRVMAPTVSRSRYSNRSALLFPISKDFKTHKKGVLGILEATRYGGGAFGMRRLVDAVPVAGMRAATGNRRRAVIVVLGAGDEDASAHSLQSVRSYLDDLAVPLFVWDLSGRPRPQNDPWGTVEDLSSFRRVRGAVREVRDTLASQRIVWLAGRHLPQEIELKDNDAAIRLLGQQPTANSQ